MNRIEQALQENQEALHSLVVFHRAANAIVKKEVETIKKHNLTVCQFGVLEALYNKGDLRIQDLIDKLLSTSGNMTVVIRNMIRDGYVVKVPDTKDRRSFLVGLTPLGRERIEAILPEHYENIGRIFSVISPEEQVILADILKQFKNLKSSTLKS
ncbi:MarR family winged helix-turn-helix transcriptional regulator [Streptococcus suis]|uniref:MarR family winged helix-turn-helix transcriptional regulator n=1 Tax=Streptococcus suis TaxID=1307 RepID=UPI001ABEB07B|nr:MarR family transcriptional regulator [Streptococcus suis]